MTAHDPLQNEPEGGLDDAAGQNSEAIETVRGSGNVFRDFGLPSADLIQLRATLAAHVIKALDARKLSVREAEKLTGTPYADFSRIRNAKLSSFTIDKLMTILDRLGMDVQVRVDVRPRTGAPVQERLL